MMARKNEGKMIHVEENKLADSDDICFLEKELGL
jgi:hypothetical protein